MNFINVLKGKMFFVLLVTGLFALIGVLVIRLSTGTPKGIEEDFNKEIQKSEQVPQNNIRRDPKIYQNQSMLNELIANPASLNIELNAVDNSSSKGVAYLLVRDNTVSHAVVASMPELAEGNVYEGWLVQPNPLKFFSTGVMERYESNTWKLEYTVEGDYPSYVRVVITEEKVLDEIPEKHILQGDF